MAFDYSDASVLVTGGSSGIGLAIARAFVDAGARVSITGRKASASDYDTDLADFGYLPLDVGDGDAITALSLKIDRLDILINNAGGMQGDEWQADTFSQSLQVNLASVFELSQALKPQLEKSQLAGGASIIGIASMTSFFGQEWTPGYGAAKAGLVQLTKTLAMSWGKNGIRANAVAAGLTRTPFTAPGIDALPEMVESTLARQGLKRLGEPEDISGAVLFLCSPMASWITGQTLAVDGGFSTGMA